MSDLPNYLTVSQLISLARAQGVSFGTAAPKVHLAYLSKLGLIPHAVKRKYHGKLEGHYPTSTLNTLSEIQEMKNRGISYANMKFFDQPTTDNVTQPTIRQTNYSFIFMAIAIFAAGVLFGFFLNQTGQNLQDLSLSSSSDGPIYLMTLDKQPNNLYKLGSVSPDRIGIQLIK